MAGIAGCKVCARAQGGLHPEKKNKIRYEKAGFGRRRAEEDVEKGREARARAQQGSLPAGQKVKRRRPSGAPRFFLQAGGWAIVFFVSVVLGGSEEGGGGTGEAEAAAQKAGKSGVRGSEGRAGIVGGRRQAGRAPPRTPANVFGNVESVAGGG